jgi:drug/metabolite transporter (DMT)-like permease
MLTFPDRNHTIGFSLAVIGTLLFSVKSIFIKLLYQQGLNADSVLVLRMLMALPIYTLILIVSIRSKPQIPLPINTVARVFLLGFFGYYLASLLDLMGLELISAQLERLSLFTYPFLIAILGLVLYREPISIKLMIAMLISYSGLWLVMGKELELTGNNVSRGVILVLGSALSYACYVLLSRKWIKQLSAIIFTSIAMISSSLFGLAHGLIIVDWQSISISLAAWWWLSMLVIFSTVIPSFMITEAISKIGATQTGLTGMLGPIFTIVLAVYILSEPFTIEIAIGVGLVLAGVMSLMIKK